MNYEDARAATVTREQARREIIRHGLAWTDFVADCGDRASYRGRTILDWLGY
jgi:hypothetical protein